MLEKTRWYWGHCSRPWSWISCCSLTCPATVVSYGPMTIKLGPMEAPCGCTFTPVGKMLNPSGWMLTPCRKGPSLALDHNASAYVISDGEHHRAACLHVFPVQDHEWQTQTKHKMQGPSDTPIAEKGTPCCLLCTQWPVLDAAGVCVQEPIDDTLHIFNGRLPSST